LDAIEGRFPGLLFAGRKITPGVTVGSSSRVPAAAIKGAPIFVGSRCQIATNAELMSASIVSSNCVIDRRAILRRSVIMPRSYVGPLLEVSNAIVAGDLLIDVDTGAHTRVADSFMLSHIDRLPFGAIVKDTARWFGACFSRGCQLADAKRRRCFRGE
jgi:NDP-sugar pyrophosphorylase family protein